MKRSCISKLAIMFRVVGLSIFMLNIGFSVAQAKTLLGNRWPSIIDALESSGVHRIGDLNLTQFRQSAKRIRWGEIEGQPDSIYSGSRENGYYHDGQAHLSTNQPEAAAFAIAQLELHEILGAMRFRDGSFGISGVLVMLSKMPDSVERRHLIMRYGQTIFKNKVMRMADGGATGVSGGGGLGLAAIKQRVLDRILSEGQIPQDSFMQMYPKINFEGSAHSEVVLKYQYTIGRNRKPDGEYLTVIVPVNSANKVDPALIEDVATKLTALFPAHRSSHVEPFHPRECESGKTINFPPSNDRAVRIVQDMRGAVLLGCVKPMYGEVSRGTTTSADESIKQIREPMQPVFVCELRRDGQLFDQRTLTAQFRVGTMSYTAPMAYSGMSGDGRSDSVLPMIHIDARTGQIRGSTLVYHAVDGARFVSPTVASTSPYSIEQQLKTPEGTVAVSCRYSPKDGM